jgi:hypothetical protein
MGYFRLADRVSVFRDLDGWIRRRLRQVRWKDPQMEDHRRQAA